MVSNVMDFEKMLDTAAVLALFVCCVAAAVVCLAFGWHPVGNHPTNLSRR